MSIVDDYYKLCDEMAERARLELEECDDDDRSEAVRRALDSGFIYGDDELTVVAHAYHEGAFGWGDEVNWYSLYEDFASDIENALDEILED